MAPPGFQTETVTGTTRIVTSLAEHMPAPDTFGIAMALQTTLDLEELLETFSEQVQAMVRHDGVQYLNEVEGIDVPLGNPSGHRCGYRMSLRGTPLGELVFYRHRPFGEADLARLELLLGVLAYPLRNGLNYRAALQAALKDPLTGLGNRAGLEEALEREVALAQRYDHPFTLMAADLDLFKRINDEHGHQSGDCVLRSVAERLQHSLRNTDLVYRYGGEEFVMLLPNTPLQSAVPVAERIRRTIASTTVNTGKAELRVTLSIGIAALAEGDDGNRLFDKADQALYSAKDGGRDRVEVWRPDIQ